MDTITITENNDGCSIGMKTNTTEIQIVGSTASH